MKQYIGSKSTIIWIENNYNYMKLQWNVENELKLLKQLRPAPHPVFYISNNCQIIFYCQLYIPIVCTIKVKTEKKENCKPNHA